MVFENVRLPVQQTMLGAPAGDFSENKWWNTCCVYWWVQGKYYGWCMNRLQHDVFLRDKTYCPSDCRWPPIADEDGENCCGGKTLFY